MTGLRRMLAVAGAAVLVVSSAGGALATDSPSAASSSADTETAQGEGGSQLPPVMMVLDGSGSMAQRDVGGSGSTRLAAVQKAAEQMIDSLPDDTRLGLMTYGSQTEEKAANKAKGCQDISVLSSVGPLDRAELKQKVGDVEATGFTPIGAALERAAEQLPEGEKASIVLLSDGEDTCAPPPPCDVVKKLSEKGVDVAVHTVGLRVSGAAKKQLECIAEATGGTYADATDTGSISASLWSATTAALTRYAPSGTPIEGGTTEDAATQIAEPGQYLDSIGTKSRNGDTRYYTLRVEPGQNAIVAASLVLPEDATVTNAHDLRIRITDPRHEGCQVRGFSPAGRGRGGLPLSSSAQTGTIGADNVSRAGASCFTQGGDYVVEIERSSPHDREGTTLPVELSVLRVDESVTSQEDAIARPSASTPEFLKPSTADGPRVVGGATFGEARRLTDSSVRGVLRVGETQYFAVPVREGQRLRTRVEVGPAYPGQKFSGYPSANAWLVDPARRPVDSVVPDSSGAPPFPAEKRPHSNGSKGVQTNLTEQPKTLVATMPEPVSTGFVQDREHDAVSLPGYYFVAIGAQSVNQDGWGQPVAYTLDWDTVGEPSSELFLDGATLGEGASDSGDGSSDGSAAGDGAAAGDSEDSKDPGASGDGRVEARDTSAEAGGLPGWVPIGIGVGAAALLALGVVVALIVRRRPSR